MVPLRKQLKDAREKRNLTIQQVAALTNIKTEHIRALEEGNYAFFSAPIYIRGFARSIAIALKMDLLSVMGQLDIELSEQRQNLKNADLHKSSEPLTTSTLSPDTSFHFPWKWVSFSFFGLILSILAFFTIRYFIHSSDPKLNTNSSGQSNPSPGIILKDYSGSLDLPTNTTTNTPPE